MRDRTPADRAAAERATDREVGVVAAVLTAGSEKAAAHRLGLSHSTVKHHLANARSKVGAETTAQLVWMLAERLPEPTTGGGRSAGENRRLKRSLSRGRLVRAGSVLSLTQPERHDRDPLDLVRRPGRRWLEAEADLQPEEAQGHESP